MPSTLVNATGAARTVRGAAPPITAVDAVGSASRCLLGLVLVAAPFLLGGVPDRVRAGLGVIASSSVLLAFGAVALDPRVRRERKLGSLGAAAWHPALLALALAWLAWIGLTMVPLVSSVLARVAPGKARLLSRALIDTPTGEIAPGFEHPLSLAPGDTLDALAWLIAVLGVMQAVAATGTLGERRSWVRRVRPATRVLAWLAIASALVSLQALLQQATWNGRIAWLVRPVEWGASAPDGSRASGPFVNPDQFAAFAFLGVLAAITLLVQLCFSPNRLEHRVRGGLVATAGFAAVCSVVGLVASGSRTAFALAVVFTAALASHVVGWLRVDGRLGSTGRRRVARVAALASVIVAALLLVASAASENVRAVLVRWLAIVTPGTHDGSWGGRVAVWRQSIDLIDAFPLGVGLGAWSAIHPLVSAPPVHHLTWRHAHSDVLELLTETGLPGAALLVISVIVVVRAMFARGRSTAPHELSDRARAVLLTGLAVFAIHVSVDSPLRAPAVALALAVLVGAGARRRRDEGMCEPPLERVTSAALDGPAWRAGLVRAGGVLAAAVGLWALGVSLALADPRFAPLRAGPPAAASALSEARALLAAGGGVGRVGGGERDAAARHFRRAITLSPLLAAAHHGLAITSSDAGEAARALAHAAELAPWSSLYQDQLAMLELARGNEDDALAHVTRAVRARPELEAHPYLAGGGARGLATQLASAIEEGLTRAFAEDADPEPAGDALARFFEAREEFARQGQVLDALAARPGAARRWSLAAVRAFHRAGDTARADAEAAQMLARAGKAVTSAEIDLALEVHAALGDLDRAERVLDRVEASASHDARVALALGRVASLRGDTGAAVERYRTAAEWAPANAEAQWLLGEALRVEQRYGEALTAFERAIDLGQGTPAVWARVAEVREKRREYRQAALAYREVLRVRPGDGWVVAAVERNERLARGEPVGSAG